MGIPGSPTSLEVVSPGVLGSFGERRINSSTGFRSKKEARPHVGPRLPQAVHTKRASMSDSLASSGHASPLIASECEHR